MKANDKPIAAFALNSAVPARYSIGSRPAELAGKGIPPRTDYREDKVRIQESPRQIHDD